MDSPEVNNCSSICTRSDLSRIREVTIKKRLVWLTGKFMREHVAVNRRCAKVGSLSLQYLQTWHVIVFNLFVSFSINGLKENVESLNHYPFWEESRALFVSVNSPWMRTFFCRFLQTLSTAARIGVSVVYLHFSLSC